MSKNRLSKRDILNRIKEGVLPAQDGLILLEALNKSGTTNRRAPALSRDIAVIGLSGRYPKAKSIEEYWENLKAGKDCSSLIPEQRWDYKDYYHPDPEESKNGKMYSKWGCFIDDVDKFDPLFFKISPAEAETMDPQERIFLEVAWEAMEDGGYTRDSIREYIEKNSLSDVGVFVGETSNTYLLHGPEEWSKGNKVIPTTMPWSIANRVSYCFNFYGPSLSIDTACSSGLSAIHLACESIASGECSMAIAGGVNLYLHPIKYVWLCQMTMLSRIGKCHAFGVDADGFLPGEGVGALLLKPLEMAEADGDNIYAVIKGTAVNHDGKTTGYTVPSPTAQSDVILKALAKSGIDARTISFIEAHGTGTSLGDPIEIVGLTGAFRKYTEESEYCAISSSKSNIGHTESTAGVAGITKIIMQMKYKQLAPSLHCEILNPKIEFASTPFYVQRELSEWERPVVDGKSYPRRAGISSFGAGGVNSHVVLEEYVTERAPKQRESEKPELFLLSAKNLERLENYTKLFIEFLKGEKASKVDFQDLIGTAMLGREEMEVRLAIICSNKIELLNRLKDAEEKLIDNRTVFRESIKDHRKALASQKPNRDQIKTLLQERKLDEIARWWVKGVSFNWKSLLKRVPQKISLPRYPFKKEQLWIETVQPKKRETKIEVINERVHPMIETNISNFHDQKFTTTFNGHEFFLHDHVISNEKVLPGVAYLEMARAAAEQAESQKRVSKIKNIIWPHPIKVVSEPQKVEILLFQDSNQVSYEIISIENRKKIVHGEGKLVIADSPPPSKPHHSSLLTIKNRCNSKLTAENCYDLFNKKNISYGTTFRGIDKIYYNEEEALAYLKLNASLHSEHKDFLLHPSLMDSALQSMCCFLEPESTTTYLPFSIGYVDIMTDKLPADCYAYVKNITTRKATHMKFDITILSEEEESLVEIKDFVVRAYNQKRQPQINEDERLMDMLRQVESGKLKWDEADKLLGGSNE